MGIDASDLFGAPHELNNGPPARGDFPVRTTMASLVPSTSPVHHGARDALHSRDTYSKDADSNSRVARSNVKGTPFALDTDEAPVVSTRITRVTTASSRASGKSQVGSTDDDL